MSNANTNSFNTSYTTPAHNPPVIGYAVYFVASCGGAYFISPKHAYVTWLSQAKVYTLEEAAALVRELNAIKGDRLPTFHSRPIFD